MKKLWLLFVAILTLSAVSAQVNYSGEYGYAHKPSGNPPKDESEGGPSGSLTLFRISNNRYRFWLDVNNGWPGYHIGNTFGILTIQGDSASSDNTVDGARDKCILRFKFSPNLITVTSAAGEFNCGFGAGVFADGKYKKAKSQPLMNFEWLKRQYIDASMATVTSARAMLFEDEQCTKQKSQYFIKGDPLLVIQTSGDDTAMYTEFITKTGKFVYGWLRKSDTDSK